MENRNISVSKKNGYTLEKVKMAKRYIDEIGSNKRTFDFKRLVQMYNDVYGTNEVASGCKCQSPKYYNGIQNYYNYGKLTLINNGLATDEDFETKIEQPIPIENEENRIILANEAPVETSEPLKEDEGAVIKEGENEASEEPKKKVGRPRKNS